MLKIGMGIRTGLGLSNFKPEGQDSTTTLSLHDGVLDSITIRPYLSAALTKNIGVVANFDIETVSGFQLLDAIVQVRFMDELQLWVGQHIPANARNAFHGPFFHNSWNYNLVSQFYPMDFAVRDRGFTFWGLIGGGILKYHASMVDLQPGREIKNARYAGRVTLNLLDPENYYYASGSYFGAQDTLALGAVVQYQKGLDLISEEGDALTDNDFLGFSFDALFEKNLGTAGVITLEAGYFNFDGSGRQYFANQGTAPVPFQFSGPQPGQSVLAAVSWLAPNKLGIGRLQPNAQFQWANQDAGDAKVVDLGLGYIVDGWNHKWHANYRFGDTALGRENMVQLGAQFQI